MRCALVLLLLTLALGACHPATDKTGFAPMPVAEPAAPVPNPGAGAGADKRTRFLAYETTLRVETEGVATLFESAQSLCTQSEAEACVVLRAGVSSGESPYARLRLRATPEGVRKIVALLDAQGRVANRETVAEDLAGPIEDSARRLAMLADYRTRLEGLRDRASSNLETLIKISHELAKTESEIEARTGERAGLMRRVQTEILDISISQPGGSGSLASIAAALRRFGSNLAEGTAWTINAASYLLPAAAVLLMLGLGARAFWRRRRRAKAA